MTVENETSTFDTTVRAIASHLPGEWTVTTESHSSYDLAYATRTSDGMNLRFTVHYRDDRIEVSAIYPDGYRHGERLVMTASLARDPQAVAKDVTRKVVTPFLPRLADARAHMAQRALDAADAAVLRTNLLAALGQDPGAHPLYTGQGGGRNEYDTVSADFAMLGTEARVNVRLSGLTADQTLSLVAWLQTNAPQVAPKW